MIRALATALLAGVAAACALALAAVARADEPGPYERMLLATDLCRDSDGRCWRLERPWTLPAPCDGPDVEPELARLADPLPEGWTLKVAGCRVARRGA